MHARTMELPRRLEQLKEFDNGGLICLACNYTNHVTEEKQRDSVGTNVDLLDPSALALSWVLVARIDVLEHEHKNK